MTSTLNHKFPTKDPVRDAWILDRYLAGEISDGERMAIEAWLARTPDAKLRVGTFWHVVKNPVSPIAEQIPSGQTLWAGLKERIQRENSPIEKSSTARHATNGKARTWLHVPLRSIVVATVAAVALFVAGIYVNPLSRWDRTASFVYSTGPGERATILLSDGTHVVLNVGSRVTVPANYASGNRQLQLTGEALFRVVHRANMPLTISTATSITRVLGTTFTVREYPTDSISSIAVLDGKVAVRDVVVSADQEVNLGAGIAPVVRPAEHGRFSFEQGVLTLPRMPLSRAVIELSRWYGAEIRIGDATIGDRLIQGEFASGALTDLADVLEVAFDVRVVRERRHLTLYSR